MRRVIAALVHLACAACGASPPVQPVAREEPACQEALFTEADARLLHLVPPSERYAELAQTFAAFAGPGSLPRDVLIERIRARLGSDAARVEIELSEDGRALRASSADRALSGAACTFALAEADSSVREGERPVLDWLTAQRSETLAEVERARAAIAAFESEHGTAEARAARTAELAGTIQGMRGRRRARATEEALELITFEAAADILARQVAAAQRVAELVEVRYLVSLLIVDRGLDRRARCAPCGSHIRDP